MDTNYGIENGTRSHEASLKETKLKRFQLDFQKKKLWQQYGCQGQKISLDWICDILKFAEYDIKWVTCYKRALNCVDVGRLINFNRFITLLEDARGCIGNPFPTA